MGIKQHNFGCSKLYAKQTLCAKEISSRTRFLYKNLHNFLPVRTNVFRCGGNDEKWKKIAVFCDDFLYEFTYMYT